MLGSGLTYKQWLKKYIQPTVDADLVALKALRFMLKVVENNFFLLNGTFRTSETVIFRN